MLVQGGNTKCTMNGCSGKTASASKCKVIILGDSHLKGIFPRTDNYLSSKSEVSGFIKPGAGFEKIVGKSILGLSRLTNKDVFVCNGGANNIYSSNSKKVILQTFFFP
jgi:hypothetical protein